MDKPQKRHFKKQCLEMRLKEVDSSCLPLSSESKKVACVVTKSNIHDQKSNFAYWQSQPYEERLAALEEVRREYHLWRYGAEPRVQKVCKIIKRK